MIHWDKREKESRESRVVRKREGERESERERERKKERDRD